MISVIVPAKDAAKTLGECLQALLHQEGLQFEHDYEVIVVDDGSTDDTCRNCRAVCSKSHSSNQSGPGSGAQCGCQDCQREHCWHSRMQIVLPPQPG